MNCDDARRLVWPPEQPRLCGDEVYEARRHVESCDSCRTYFAQDHAVLEVLERLRSEAAPEHVRERVWDVLARERAGEIVVQSDGGRPRIGRTGLAALVAVSAGVALLVGVSQRHVPFGGVGQIAEGGDVFVEDYLRRAVSADHIVSSDPEEVARFLARELGVTLMPLTSDGLKVARAEICLLEGQRGAMIEYRVGNRTVSHYLIPREGVRPRSAAHLDRSDLSGMPAVVTWASHSLEHALVGEFEVEELVAFAEADAKDRW